MQPIKYDFVEGTFTIQWVPAEVKVGKIRCHVSEDVMPGPTRYSAIIEVEPNGEYELTMLKKDSDAMAGPTMREHSYARKYLESLGYHGLWRRAKRGAIKVVVNERGNIAQETQILEVLKMAKITVAMTYTNDEGKLASDVTANYYDLSYPGVVKVQGAVVGSLQALGEDAAEAVSK